MLAKTQFAGSECSVADVLRWVINRLVILVEILCPGIIAAITTAVFIANTPRTNRMILTGWDQLPLQPHRAIKRELHRFIGFKTFSVDKKEVPFFLRWIRGSITLREIPRIQILLLGLMDNDPSHRQIIVMQTQRGNRTINVAHPQCRLRIAS